VNGAEGKRGWEDQKEKENVLESKLQKRRQEGLGWSNGTVGKMDNGQEDVAISGPLVWETMEMYGPFNEELDYRYFKKLNAGTSHHKNKEKVGGEKA